MNEYYVYAYLREDGTPYYIGKGKERRAWEQHRSNGKGVHTPADYKRIVLLHEELTEVDAFDLEIKLIKQYGRQDLGTGILKNRTTGGEGSANTSPETNWKKGSARRGKPTSDETRKKLSEANQTREYPNTHTKEVRQKLSEATKKSWDKRPRTMSEEQKEKIRIAHQERWRLKKHPPG
jgi:hypothetical protein